MKKLVVRLALIITGIIVLLGTAGLIGFNLMNRTNGRIVSSGVARDYLLYVPESYDPSVPTPLVITIHGYAQWPAHQALVTHWNELADQHGFIVVYPAGTQFPLRWRAGHTGRAGTGRNEDVVFIADLIDLLAGEYNIDPERVFANGLSNGGGMTFALSCELSERIASVGMVAGAYLYPWEECTPERPTPAIIFHGTDDSIVPYRGGPSESFDIPFPSIPEWVDELARRSGCEDTPEELSPWGDVRGVRYQNCAADVVFYTITGGGHTWPGGTGLPERITGHTTRDIDATRMMWEFFTQHVVHAGLAAHAAHPAAGK